jgi:tetratricopeptide (TPR) repeat protein
MKRILTAGGLLLGFVLLGLPAEAQMGTARGKVLDDKGQPLVDAKVLMEFQGGITRKYETKTNKKGDFTQVGMQAGGYKITVTKEGYQGSVIDFRISVGDPTEIPEFRLSTAAAAAQKAGGAAADELRNAFNNAYNLTQAGKLDEAEAAYKAILTKEPNVPEVHQNLGFVYAQKKDMAKAEESYKKALELRPNNPEVTSALARVYQESGQTDKAMELINKAAGENPADAKSQFNAGVFALNAGKAEDAIAAFQKALAADPQLAEAHYHLGTLYVGQNKIPEAVQNLEKYLAMSPGNAQNVATAQGLLAALKPKK